MKTKILIITTLLLLLFTTSSFASDTQYFNYSELISTHPHYFVIERKGSYELHVSDSYIDLYVHDSVAPDNQTYSYLGVRFTGSHDLYVSTSDNSEFSYIRTSDADTHERFQKLEKISVIAASNDIPDRRDDSVFFYQRLVNPQVLYPMTQTVNQTSLVLIICGIGLLALMIGLTLLPKLFYKFL